MCACPLFSRDLQSKKHNASQIYQNFEKLSKTRYCGTGAAVIQTDERREQDILEYLTGDLERPVATWPPSIRQTESWR